MVVCPQCEASNEDNCKNCAECCINLYWAFQHYEELAQIRQTNNLGPRSETPSFLVKTSQTVDKGPIAGWLSATILKWGLKEAGKKVGTMAE